jgi:hypothetical protein
MNKIVFFLSNFEREREKKKKIEDEDIVVETAIDFEEKCDKELKSFNFEARLTPESEKENFKNINRILDRKIILLVKNEETGNWEFPAVEWNNGESLRQVNIYTSVELTVSVTQSVRPMYFICYYYYCNIGLFLLFSRLLNVQLKTWGNY